MVIAASTLSKKATPNRQGTPLPIQERYDISKIIAFII